MLLIISNAVLWLLVLVLGFLLLGNVRATGLMDWRVTQLEATTPSRIGRSGLKPGKKAPDFALASVSDGEVSLREFLHRGRRILLVFVQSDCAPCHEIVPELNRLARRETGLQVLAVCNGEPKQVRQWEREVRAGFPVLVQQRFSLSKRYEVFATPFAFLIDQKGVIASKGIISSKEHIGYLLSGADRHPKHDEVEAPGQAQAKPADANAGEWETVSFSQPGLEVDHVS